ncbi:hypothetical protein E4191_18255 (plasmid) [Paracoccus liaowanqingii]|uniref:Uncharacterized protein n=1 Tax=Paracoccus liaowanqingii TaxID=2560053 RepID=A0A4Y5ST07_9RHOB|nr:hypothetical protein E4191_18255 [Paracoccus liaowanqingii]
MTNLIDLSNPAAGHNYKVSVQPDESRAERNIRLFKDVVLFLSAIAFIGFIAWFCIVTLITPGQPPESQRWAQSVLSAAAGGLTGYLIRR